MITRLSIYKPLPKKLDYSMKKDPEHFLNYKIDTDITNVYNNILNNNEILISYINIFCRNHCNKGLLYKNIETVKTELILEDKHLDGFFDMYSNTIYYKDSESIYHELLHLASTYINKEKSKMYSGISYTDLDKRYDVGEGINEGYTQLLTDRDSNNGNMIYTVFKEVGIYNFPVYCYANTLARQLEIIIGSEQLEELYFNADFSGFIELLRKYASEKEIFRFLRNCDVACIASEYNNALLNNKTLEAQKFLEGICNNYKKEKIEEFNDNKILKINVLGFGNLVPLKINSELEEQRKSR